eukprot:15058043-Ditylum_brightwellii.AAC.1
MKQIKTKQNELNGKHQETKSRSKWHITIFKDKEDKARHKVETRLSFGVKNKPKVTIINSPDERAKETFEATTTTTRSPNETTTTSKTSVPVQNMNDGLYAMILAAGVHKNMHRNTSRQEVIQINNEDDESVEEDCEIIEKKALRLCHAYQKWWRVNSVMEKQKLVNSI